jgi:hypothetical protein
VENAVSTWTGRTIDANFWDSITWSPELSLFVAVATSGTNRVATSPDGITWTGRTIDANAWYGITWSPELSLFVAVAISGTNRVATSPDGITWTSRTIDDANDWRSVTWSPELSLFVAVASSGTNRVATSNLGIPTPLNTPMAHPGQLVVDTPTGNVGIGTSTPGYDLDIAGDVNLSGSLRIGGVVQTFGGSDVSYSTVENAVSTWTGRTIDANNWQGITWSPELSLFVAVADTGTNRVATSPDGITWTGRTIDANGWYGITWSPELSLFAAVASGGTNRVATSNLGIPTPLNTPMALPGQLVVDTPTGNVGIGTTTPGYDLDVAGDIYSTGNITAYSDKRAKENIEKIENALDKVCTLGGYTYTMKGQKYTGLIAQEVLEVLPEAVTGSEETNYALAYGNMMGLIVEAIKELKQKIG